MHPPLKRPHPDCQSAIVYLESCHITNPYLKFLGACNDAKADLDKCFRREKEGMRRRNMEEGRREWQREWDREGGKGKA